MIISVAFFFFVSAFGMIVSYEERGNYLQGFLLVKPFYLFVLAIVLYIYNYIISALCPIKLNDLLGDYGFRSFLRCTNWYIWEQILFYLLFYFTYRYCKRKQIFIIFGVVVISAIISFLSGIPECWYASSFAFPLGLFIGKYYTQFAGFLSSLKGIFSTLILTLLGLISLILPQDSLIGMVFLRNVICIAFLFFLIRVLFSYSLGDNGISYILCKYSTEIYLCQFIYLSIATSYGWNYKTGLIFVICFDLLSAWIMHPLVEKVRKGLKQLGKIRAHDLMKKK